MKIHINPLALKNTDNLDLAREEMKSFEKLIRKIDGALAKQREILGRMEASVNRGGKAENLSRELTELANALDRIVETCRTGSGAPLLDGGFSYWNARASIWFITGVHMHQRERVFVRTITCRSLNLRDGTGKITLPGDKREARRLLLLARRRIDKERASMTAYLSRIGFVDRYLKGVSRLEYGTYSVERDLRKSQIQMIENVLNSLDRDYEIARRIKELSAAAAGKSADQRLHLQVEVSQLIDEVDRLASQTEFNYYRLLCGTFSRRNPTASIWFLAGDKTRRLYIATMTARSLNLRDGSWRNITLTHPESDRKLPSLLKETLARIERERNILKGYREDFIRSGAFNRVIDFRKT